MTREGRWTPFDVCFVLAMVGLTVATITNPDAGCTVKVDVRDSATRPPSP